MMLIFLCLSPLMTCTNPKIHTLSTQVAIFEDRTKALSPTWRSKSLSTNSRRCRLSGFFTQRSSSFFQSPYKSVRIGPEGTIPRIWYRVMNLHIPKDTQFHEIWSASTPEEAIRPPNSLIHALSMSLAKSPSSIREIPFPL